MKATVAQSLFIYSKPFCTGGPGSVTFDIASLISHHANNDYVAKLLTNKQFLQEVQPILLMWQLMVMLLRKLMKISLLM
jgi:hypothetical protein